MAYDEATGTTYYDPMMVLNITEYDRKSEKDSDIFLLYDFISLTMAFSENHKVSISVNYMEDLTNYHEYDELQSNVTRFNEVVAYDNIHLSKKRLERYLKAFM